MASRKKTDLSGLFGDALKTEPVIADQGDQKTDKAEMKPEKKEPSSKSMTFRIQNQYIFKIEEYARSHRMTKTAVLDLALEEFFGKQ